jgi:hypothetical protein
LISLVVIAGLVMTLTATYIILGEKEIITVIYT